MIDINTKLYIIGDIDHDAYRRFTKQLSRLEAESNGKGSAHIVLMSDGGDANVALAFYDRIQLSSLSITIAAVGLVASAAVLVLVAPPLANRRMGRSAWVMVHDDEVQNVDGLRVVHAEKAVKHYLRMENQWNRIMTDSCSGSIEFWEKLHKKETYLTAEDCVKLGIVKELL